MAAVLGGLAIQGEHTDCEVILLNVVWYAYIYIYIYIYLYILIHTHIIVYCITILHYDLYYALD